MYGFISREWEDILIFRISMAYSVSDIPHQIELNECSEDFVVRYNDHVHSRWTG
jgi:hypothetical protein